MAYKGDMDTEDLDQLIHSYEYENQNFVKMIEQENQLIKALESQIEESTEDTKRMETDISHFEDETQRLLKQCNINKVNIDSQKKTRGLMCDHEAALLKKLESFKLETAEKQKFYKENIVKYSDIRDDHMRKYRCFPVAIELENKKAEVLSAQELVSQAESTKTTLKEMVAAKEDELNSKVMSRIIVKIAKAKLRTFQLDKEIQECLHQRDALLKQVEDVSHSKQSVQTNDCVHQYNEEIPMETGEESLAPKNSRGPPQSNENKSAQNKEQEKFAFDCTNDQDMLDEQNEICESASYVDQSSGRRQQELMPSEISRQTTEQHGISGCLTSTPTQRDGQKEPGNSVNVSSSFTACQGDQPLRESEPCTSAVYSEKTATSAFPRLTATPRYSQADFTRTTQQPLLQSQKVQPTTSSTSSGQNHHNNVSRPQSVLLTSTAVSRLPVPCFGKSSLLKNQEKQANVDIKKFTAPSFFPKFNLPQTTLQPRQPCTPLARQLRQPCTPLAKPPYTPLVKPPCTTLPRQPYTPLPRQDAGQLTSSSIDQTKAPNLQHEIGQHKTPAPGTVQNRQSFQSFLPRFPSKVPPQTNKFSCSGIRETTSSSTSLVSNEHSNAFQTKGIQAQQSVRLAPSMSLSQKTGDSSSRTAPSVSLPMKQDRPNGEQSKQNLENNSNSRNVREDPSESFRTLHNNTTGNGANKFNFLGDSILQEPSYQEREPLFKLNIDISSDKRNLGATGVSNSQTSGKFGKQSSQTSQHFEQRSFFGNFDANDCDDDDDDTDRSALYNLFKFSGKSKDSSKDEENASSAVFTLGKFMENDSDSSEVEPATFLNFYSGETAEKRDHAQQEFSLNFASELENTDGISNDGADGERPQFKLFDKGIDF